MPRQSTDKSFFSKRNPRLTFPRDCRVELARAYKSWLVGQIEADALKTATFVLNVLTGMMKGSEAEAELAAIRKLVDDIEAKQRSTTTSPRANGHHRHAEAERA